MVMRNGKGIRSVMNFSKGRKIMRIAKNANPERNWEFNIRQRIGKCPCLVCILCFFVLVLMYPILPLIPAHRLEHIVMTQPTEYGLDFRYILVRNSEVQYSW